MLDLLPLFLLATFLLTAIYALTIYRGLTHPSRRAAGWALAHDLPTDPAGFGLEFQELSIPLPDGKHAPTWLVHGRAANAPILVVCHGWSESRYVMLKRLPLWSELFSAVLLYDLRAHGDSPHHASFGGPPEADDLRAILEQLPPHLHSNPSIVLLGLSMGASIAMQAIVRDNLSPAPIALIAEGAYRHRLTPVAGYLRQRRWPTWPFLNLVGLYLSLFPKRFGPLDGLTRIEKVTLPTLFIHGQFDAMCPLVDAQALAQHAPSARCVIFQGADHLNMAELDPQTYQTAIDDFLRTLGLPQPPIPDPSSCPRVITRYNSPPCPHGK
ncbi:MAG: alpha/beta hydrolase [Phycisphaeraceae bacterium]|nr:alpha/beta hydrolase [Phycisphaeraceae bacterium]